MREILSVFQGFVGPAAGQRQGRLKPEGRLKPGHDLQEALTIALVSFEDASERSPTHLPACPFRLSVVGLLR